jgi:hypothetical protein
LALEIPQFDSDRKSSKYYSKHDKGTRPALDQRGIEEKKLEKTCSKGPVIAWQDFVPPEISAGIVVSSIILIVLLVPWKIVLCRYPHRSCHTITCDKNKRRHREVAAQYMQGLFVSGSVAELTSIPDMG